MPTQAQIQMQQIRGKAFNARMAEIARSCGGSIPPDKQEQAKQQAMQYAQQVMMQHQTQQRRMMMQAQMNGMAGGQMIGAGMNGMGMGVNGMGMQ